MSQPGMPQETVAAVQAALGAEHAALWVYGLVSAFLPAAYDKALREGVTEHRERRDATAELLAAAGITPAPAEAAYVPPEPVEDEASAAKLVATAETDATVAWRAVLERCDDKALRESALAALTGSSVRTTRWRTAAGVDPAVPSFPGQP
ncbi:ferritin-like domain-containing protein [Actinokineospora sp. UTMC 2448]|uniref:ferritin-like domain-containing protein n=1 Tax=Actinokineospora sp. UTMC 2448 TaxID=2268449 RepID=UPI00216431AB|nr:ferritin-like domain-containing protein [Actinokineospora sp. UTMC 2448]